MTTPNMNLTLPLVSQTPGPTWASQINADLTIIDSHNHTAGKGSPITPAAISVNADLPFNSHSATGLQSVQFDDQIALVTTNTIYTVGGDLYYNNGSSTPIPITLGGSLAGTAGTITGIPSGTASASFNPGTGTFTFDQATNTGAILSSSTLKVRSTAPSSNSIDITTPTGTTGYTLTLPISPPGSGYSLVVMGASGALSLAAANSTITLTGTTISVGTVTSSNIDAGAVGTTQLATGAVTGAKMAAVNKNQTISSGTVGFAGTGSWQSVYASPAFLVTTTQRPIVVMLQAITTAGSAAYITSTGLGFTGLELQVKCSNGVNIFYENYIQIGASSVSTIYYPPSIINCLFQPNTTGTWTFDFQVKGTGTINIRNCTLIAYQL